MNQRSREKSRFSRAELKKHRGKDTSDVIWEILVTEGYTTDHAATLETLTRKALQLEAHSVLSGSGYQGPERRQKRARGSELRAEAISRLLAEKARSEPEIGRAHV